MSGGTEAQTPRRSRSRSRSRRRRSSRWRAALKPAALVVVIAFAAWYVIDNWHEVLPVLRTLLWWQYVAALAAIGAALSASMMSWRSLLISMGTRLPLTAAARVFFLGQLGKYVPGSVWPIVAQAELAKEYGAPRTRSGAALLVQMAVSTVAGIVFAAGTLAASSPTALLRYWWLLLIAVVGIVCLAPAVFGRLMRVAGRVTRRPMDDVAALSWGALGRAGLWCLVMWAFLGLHMWVLASTIAGPGANVVLVTAGGYALAWIVGFVIVFLPAGAGAREAALTLALAPVMSAPSALGLALASRFLTLAADGISAVAAVTMERIHRRASAQHDEVAEGTESRS